MGDIYGTRPITDQERLSKPGETYQHNLGASATEYDQQVITKTLQNIPYPNMENEPKPEIITRSPRRSRIQFLNFNGCKGFFYGEIIHFQIRGYCWAENKYLLAYTRDDDKNDC